MLNFRRVITKENETAKWPEKLGEGELWIIRLSSIVFRAESNKRIEETFP